MPDIITHYIFGLDTAHNIKQSPLYKIIKENLDIFSIGLQGPDPIYYHHLGLNGSKASVASRMHTEKTGDFLVSALCHIRKYDTNSKEFQETLSYLSGFLCHYILDGLAHPYIFYLGGRYIKGQPETYKYKGLHKKIEIAIDSILCEEKFGIKASRFKIHKHILKDISIPTSIINLYDEMLFLLYGINGGGKLFSTSYEDTRTYFKLTYDQLGAKKVFANFASPLLPKQISTYATTFSYFHCINPDVDYLNKSRHVWLHPVTGNVYTFSFYDLLRNATKKSTSLLLATYDFATSNLSTEEFRCYVPNHSYLTGLNTDDTRPMKYFSPDIKVFY